MLYLLLLVCVVLASSAFGTVFAQAAETPQEASADTTEARQTASAYLDQSEDIVVDVTVDLSGGWSVEFARGAVYLYDGEITEGKDCAAMLITLDEEVYGEYLEEALADENHVEADGGVYFPFYEDEGAYLTSLEDSAFILITAANDTDIEAIVSRFALAAEAGEIPAAEWPRDGFFLDENENMLTVTWMDDIDDPGWQNPVMNFVGEYQCDRAHATVECFGNEDAWIIIEWGGSATELARWDIVGRLDTDTLTIEYSGVTKDIITYDENGEVVSQESEYEDGTGTITFNDDGTFTWHEDQSDYGMDMVFEWVPVADD